MSATVLDQNFTMVLDSELIQIVNSDWTKYDRQKLKESADPCYFSCNVGWEVDYLVNKICTIHNKYTERNSRRAINMVCMASNTPTPREHYLEQVMGILQLL